MGVNKVQGANGEVYIDISNDTVTPETLAFGVTAHGGNGEEITGTMNPNGSIGLEYTLNSDGESYTVSKGTCTEAEIIIPSHHNGLPVTEIGSGNFEGLTTVKRVHIPNTVKTIYSDAFKNCTNLKTINIPRSVKTIYSGAFVGTSLEEVYLTRNITTLDKDVFPDTVKVYCEPEIRPDNWTYGWNSNITYPITWGVPMSLVGIDDEFEILKEQFNWDSIQNKPFTETGSHYLYWEGDTAGCSNVGVYYHLSDVVPTKKELTSKVVKLLVRDGESTEQNVKWEYNYAGNGIDKLLLSESDGSYFLFAFIVRKTNAVYESASSPITFSKTGIWVTKSYATQKCRLYIPYFNRFSPRTCVLKPECLPKNEELPTEEKDIFGAISELHNDIGGINTEIANINDRIDLLHNPKVVDLEGTTWRLNDTIPLDKTITYAVDFVANGSAYNKLIMNSTVGVDGSTLQKISYGKAINIVYNNGIWDNTNNQYVTFTGGTDSTNLDLIDWCYTHGELLSINLSGLQPKVDEGLETEDKAIVGAINEINKKKPIIDVVALPIYNIKKESFYRLYNTQWLCYGEPVENFTCHCVETLPENPEPITSDMVSIVTYFSLDSRLVYGYVDEMISAYFNANFGVEIPVGWHDARRLLDMVGITYDGFVADPYQSVDNPNMVLLVQRTLYTYDYVGWTMLKSIGYAGTGTNAEIFNDLSNDASGDYSHAEGRRTYAQGSYSHAQGLETVARGVASSAEGYFTIAEGDYSHAQGKNNLIDDEGKYAHIVGNGNDNERSNAHTIDWQGNGWFAGDIKVGGKGQDDPNAKKVATEEYVDNAVANAGGGSSNGFEMPQIRFTSATGSTENDTPMLYVDIDNPLKINVEIVGGGALQVGDQLQVCRRKRFSGSMSNGFKRKYKLQRFAEYVITEEDLGKKYLTVEVACEHGNPDKMLHHAHRGLFHDGMASGIAPLYLRIRRPKGAMHNNDSGQTVDADFSNIVTIWKHSIRGTQSIRIQ